MYHKKNTSAKLQSILLWESLGERKVGVFRLKSSFWRS